MSRSWGIDGRFISTTPAIERFRAKCRFDACTGCVNWIGGTTAGQGHTARYGAFWFEGRRWFAHRWAAQYVHGLHVDYTVQIDHMCRNTLCVQHLQSVSPTFNRELQWIRVQVGLEPEPEPYVYPEDVIPFHIAPEWLR